LTIEPLEHRALLASGLTFPVPVGFAMPSSPGPSADIRHAPIGGERVATNVQYTSSGPAEALDVYVPSGQAPASGWPVVVAIHGGGWRRFSKDEYARKVARPLLASGFAVVAPNYVLSAPGVSSWPQNFEDIRQAVQWVRTNAATFALDPNQIAAMGESAGGHLAALLGTNPNGLILSDPSRAAPPAVSAQVQAVVDFFGPTDLAAIDQQSVRARPAVEQFLGATPAQNPAEYADASPVDHVSAASAPMLILQGTADPIVPVSQAQELASALTKASVANQLIIIPGATHGFGFTTNGRDLLPTIVSFLSRTFAERSPSNPINI
jgi:acetyl esterase/lipase